MNQRTTLNTRNLWLLFLIAVVLASTAGASDFQVNNYTTGNQYAGSVASIGNSGFIIVWSSTAGITSGWGQRYASDGSPVGSNFPISDQARRPSVAGDETGRFVIVYHDYYTDGSGGSILVRRFDSSGSQVGTDMQVNSYTTGGQMLARAAMNDQGNFVVVWYSIGQDGDNRGIFGKIFDSTGQTTGGEFLVNNYTTDFQDTSFVDTVTMDAAGNFVVVWEDRALGQHTQGRRFDSSGNPQGPSFPLGATFSEEPGVGAADDGRFVIIRSSYPDIKVQRYSSSGVVAGAEFAANSSTTFMNRDVGSVSVASGGDFVVAWDNMATDGLGIFSRRINSDGSSNGDELQVNTYTTANQKNPQVALSDTGSFMVVWESDGQDGNYRGIYASFNASSSLIFVDDFESGGTTPWSSTVGGGP